MLRFFTLALIISFITPASSLAQEHFMSGRWEGNYNDTWGSFLGISPKKLVVELFVNEDNSVTGSSHLYYIRGHYEHYRVRGRYNASDSTISFSEDSTIGVKLGFLAGNCLGDYNMELSASDTMLRLKGRWKENDYGSSGCGSSGVWLNKPLRRKAQAQRQIDCFGERYADTSDKELKRKVDIQSLVELDKSERDTIRFELRDNAEIDGDIVSVYINDCLLVNKYRLQKEPYVFYLSIPNGISMCNLQLIAHSLGSIPPCTATLKVITKKKQYEVSLSSSMSNNGMLQLFIKE